MHWVFVRSAEMLKKINKEPLHIFLVKVLVPRYLLACLSYTSITKLVYDAAL